MADLADWEGAAAELLDGTCTSTPVDAFALAAACGLKVRVGGARVARLDGNVIHIAPKMCSPHQHMGVCHELGHFALARHGLEDSEEGAKYIGGALLMPRREMRRDLVATAWSITKLRERHVNAYAIAIAERITQLCDAVATIIDPRGRKKSRRILSPWINEPHLAKRTSAWERELALKAWETGEEIRGDELCYAVPVIDFGEDRVIVVCELEQLGLRL